MNVKQIALVWITGVLTIGAIVVFSYDYRYFWLGANILWAVLITGGFFIYILRDRRQDTLESCVNRYMLQLKTAMFLRIISDVLLLSLPVFLVKFLVRDIRHCIRRIKGQVD